jgi:RNA polymerase primary sigma factor
MKQLVITKQITNRTNQAVDKYLQDISKFELISTEEEVELTKRIRAGDFQALEKLVIANLRFVVSVAKQYQNRGLSLQDLINEGNLGLIKAAQRFDETRGFKFISYAVWWIRQSIIQALGEYSRVIRLPFNKIANVNKINKAILELEQEFQREPTEEEIATITKITSEMIKDANRIKGQPLYLDAPIVNSEDEDKKLNELININNMPSPDINLISESLQTEINAALKYLSHKEKIIVEYFFGLNNRSQLTLNEIATKLNLSRERVRQIKNGALKKLQKSPNKNVLQHYV